MLKNVLTHNTILKASKILLTHRIKQFSSIIHFFFHILYTRNKYNNVFVTKQGSPNNPYNLKLVSIYDCRQCVIMSTLDRGNLDTYLVDKSSILCALTIRQIAMKQAGLHVDLKLTRKSKIGRDLAESSLLFQNPIHTLTTLSNKCMIDRFSYYLCFILAIDSNVQYVEQGIRVDYQKV